MTQHTVRHFVVIVGAVFFTVLGGCQQSTTNQGDMGPGDITSSTDVSGNVDWLADIPETTPEPTDVMDGDTATVRVLDAVASSDAADSTTSDMDSTDLDVTIVPDTTEFDGLTTCTPEGPAFSEVYEKVFKLSCTFASCHGANPAKKNGFLDLRPDAAWDALVGKLAANPAAAEAGMLLVDPCFPDQSFLVLKMELPPAGDPKYGGPMPKVNGGGLPQETIQLVKDWIAAGARKN